MGQVKSDEQATKTIKLISIATQILLNIYIHEDLALKSDLFIVAVLQEAGIHNNNKGSLLHKKDKFKKTDLDILKLKDNDIECFPWVVNGKDIQKELK
ncbi:2209_t:CDS:2 [Entrophospora sp. SA101]|nr:2209_t:CDS:2 [Entrophospora sp. SA101]